MMKVPLLFALSAHTLLVQAQEQWAAAGAPCHVLGFLRHVSSNPTKDTIYFAGAINIDGGSWQDSNAVLRYCNGQWDTLGVLNAEVMSVVVYHDTLIAGGNFLNASGASCRGIAFHDGVSWQPYGDFGVTGVRMLRVLEDELYAVGGFTEVDGQPASGVAKRIGNGWEPIGQMDSAGLLDIAIYNGKLVVVGNIDFPNGRNIAQWDGNEWSLLGPGIVNLMSGGQCLAVYQGDLYVGGQIALAPPDNPGQNIMRWDGTQFHALGQGIQWWLGNSSSIATVMEMVEHDGKLFVGGGYRAAGGIDAQGLSTWDGVEWCAVPGDFRSSGGIWGMDFYRDTLFVACGTVLDGDTVNGLVKFIGDEYTTTCSGPVGLPNIVGTNSIRLFPNPGSMQISLSGLPADATIEVYDGVGRSLYTNNGDEDHITIRTGDWPPGTYFISINHPKEKRMLKWIKA